MDYKKLQPLSDNKNKNNHLVFASDNDVCKQGVKILTNNLEEFLLSKPVYDCSSLLISENNWFRRRKNYKCIDSYGNELNIQERQILQIDYGKTYRVECGIIHYCVILKVMDKKIFTIPMTTNEDVFNRSFHPIENPTGKYDFRQGLKSEGYTANAALYINDIKCVSIGRVLPYTTVDLISEKAFRELQDHIMRFHFKDTYKDLCEENERLNKENMVLKETLEKIKKTIDNIDTL